MCVCLFLEIYFLRKLIYLEGKGNFRNKTIHTKKVMLLFVDIDLLTTGMV